ncbi:MAG: hypothetical protein KGL39_39825 [Patescibacteria group bacterium]|nr:hypothetical protein [Patescibacteria group bacterium]
MTTKTPVQEMSSPMMEPSFDQVWEIWPRKVGKFAAFKEWERALKLTTPAKIMDAVKLYAASRVGKDPQYTCHFRTWLHQGRWEDKPSPSRTVPVGGFNPGAVDAAFRQAGWKWIKTEKGMRKVRIADQSSR